MSLFIILCIKYTRKCFQLLSLKQRGIQDEEDLLELNAARENMVQSVRRLERNIARKKEEREKLLNRDNERGKNSIHRSGIIIVIIMLLRSSNFYPYRTQERQSYSVQTSSLSWEWRFLNDERIPSHPSFPACSGWSEPHHPRQEEAAAGDGGRPNPGREGGQVPYHEDTRSLAQAPEEIQWSQ